jgi:hypothetical protein
MWWRTDKSIDKLIDKSIDTAAARNLADHHPDRARDTKCSPGRHLRAPEFVKRVPANRPAK